MRIVIAVGGNALLLRKQAPTAQNQVDNVKLAARQLARVAASHQLIVVHGNGPQVGLLALQADAFRDVPSYPLDMLGAESDGLIGYLLEQEIANCLQGGVAVATVLTRVEVDPDDPAFDAPSKPIGPVYDDAQANQLAAERGWTMAADTGGRRRVVASPAPRALVDDRPLRWLLDHGAVLICGGGGGIPVVRHDAGHRGVEAVIDKDACAALIAEQLDADLLVIATDVDAVYTGWGTPQQQALGYVVAAELARHTFAAGSMAPKVLAARRFADGTGRPAAIGALGRIEALVTGDAGTRVLPA